MTKKILFLLIISGTFYSKTNAQGFFSPTLYTNSPQGVGANRIFGWGESFDRTIDIRPNPNPTYGSLMLNYHTGLTFSANSTYGGIRFYNQGYPNPYDLETGAAMVMSLTNGRVGVGTVNPGARLTVEGSETTSPSLLIRNLSYDSRVAAGTVSMQFAFANHTGPIIEAYKIKNNVTGLKLYTEYGYNTPQLGMVINGTINGPSVGIGTNTPDINYSLSVNGSIRSKEVKVETAWSDYVFEKGYELKTLQEVEDYISKNQHLPEVPSAAEVEENGIKLGETNALLLKKIEELTLYLIQKDKEVQQLENRLGKLEKSVKGGN